MRLLILITFFLYPLHHSYLCAAEFDQARKEMVEIQIQGRGVRDKAVLKAMLKVPRHEFVPAAVERLAYADRPLPIGEDQTISQPYIVALMTEVLELKPTDKILEIGTGSGYHAAVLAEIAKKVYTIEIIPSLAKSANERLKKLGYKNIWVKAGDGYLGWPDQAPFDAIVLTASPPKVPQPLIDQLKEGGRLVVPLGGAEKLQELVLYRKEQGAFKITNHIAPVLFVPMTGRIQEKK